MIRRIVGAACAAALVASLGASVAFAGEVTGNGKLLHVDGGGKWGTGLHARSFCAYSGQEDLQFFTDDGDGTPVDTGAGIAQGAETGAGNADLRNRR